MRRGKISNTNFIIIIAVAIFTLISYIADQFVIRNEDSLRKLNIEYNNTRTELRSNESVSASIALIQLRAGTIVDDYVFKRNIWIKSLLLIEADKNYQNFFTNRKLNYKWDLKHNLVQDYYNITADINSVREEFQDIIMWLDDHHYKKIEEMNPFDLFHNLDYEINNDEFFIKDKKVYIDLLLIKKSARNKLINSFTIKNWFDVYKFTMLRVEMLYQDMDHLDAYTEYFDNLILNNKTSLNDIMKKQKRISLEKNSLILISILTQIIALLALLLLFRNFIIKNR